jgi:hypothetical protein
MSAPSALHPIIDLGPFISDVSDGSSFDKRYEVRWAPTKFYLHAPHESGGDEDNDAIQLSA